MLGWLWLWGGGGGRVNTRPPCGDAPERAGPLSCPWYPWGGLPGWAWAAWVAQESTIQELGSRGCSPRPQACHWALLGVGAQQVKPTPDRETSGEGLGALGGGWVGGRGQILVLERILRAAGWEVLRQVCVCWDRGPQPPSLTPLPLSLALLPDAPASPPHLPLCPSVLHPYAGVLPRGQLCGLEDADSNALPSKNFCVHHAPS